MSQIQSWHRAMLKGRRRWDDAYDAVQLSSLCCGHTYPHGSKHAQISRLVPHCWFCLVCTVIWHPGSIAEQAAEWLGAYVVALPRTHWSAPVSGGETGTHDARAPHFAANGDAVTEYFCCCAHGIAAGRDGILCSSKRMFLTDCFIT